MNGIDLESKHELTCELANGGQIVLVLRLWQAAALRTTCRHLRKIFNRPHPVTLKLIISSLKHNYEQGFTNHSDIRYLHPYCTHKLSSKQRAPFLCGVQINRIRDLGDLVGIIPLCIGEKQQWWWLKRTLGFGAQKSQDWLKTWSDIFSIFSSKHQILLHHCDCCNCHIITSFCTTFVRSCLRKCLGAGDRQLENYIFTVINLICSLHQGRDMELVCLLFELVLSRGSDSVV